jgi:hypothetical protein
VIGADALEASLVLVAGVWALLHLDHLGGFEHLEAMAAVGEQDYVACFEDAAFEIRLVVVVEVNPNAAGLYEQHFLGVLNLARHRAVDVGGDHVTAGAAHVAQLLGEMTGSEKFDSLGIIASAEDEGQGSALPGDLLHQCIGFLRGHADQGLVRSLKSTSK